MIAPPALEVDSDHLRLGSKITKTLFLFTYPRYLSTGWFSSIVNVPDLLDVSIFIHPMETPLALKNLQKKAAQIQAQINESEEKGQVRNPMLETAIRDIETLRDSLQQAEENLFSVSVYITLYADDQKSLDKLESSVNSLL